MKHSYYILLAIIITCVTPSRDHTANAAQPSPSNPPIMGKAHIIDGDSLRINKHEIRLFGIDAPEYKQHCYDLDGKAWPCGIQAKKELIKHIDGRILSCKRIKTDQYQRILSECFLPNQESINAWIVRNGWAVSYKRYTEKYTKAQKQAKASKTGIWTGYFLSPERWRYHNKR